MYLILRIILYPLCLGFGIWCAVQFKEGFEDREIRRYKIDTDNPGEILNNDPANEESADEESADEESTDGESTDGESTDGESVLDDEDLDESTNQDNIELLEKVEGNSLKDNGDTNEVETLVAEDEKAKGSLVGYIAGMLVSILTFAFFVARDVGNLAGNRIAKGFYNKSEKSEKADLYEEAEQLWADGAYIESIDALRNYTEKYPGEFHAHQRIAEIYENDLASYRAAALEYESILTMDLPTKRWGWAAIHLCNLYSGKLGETEKALELLRRVADECADTTPGQKAKERLAKIDAM